MSSRRSERAWRAGAALLANVGEIVTGAAIVAGWLLITDAVAQLLPPRIVWSASIGLLLFCLAGIRFIGELAWQGLYVLTREAAAPAAPARPRRVS